LIETAASRVALPKRPVSVRGSLGLLLLRMVNCVGNARRLPVADRIEDLFGGGDITRVDLRNPGDRARRYLIKLKN
jgi:hypothetical protein